MIIVRTLHDSPAGLMLASELTVTIERASDGLLAAGYALREIVLMVGRVLEKPELIRLGAIPARANDTTVPSRDSSIAEWFRKSSMTRGMGRAIARWR